MKKYYCVYGKKDGSPQLLGLSESESMATDYGGSLYELGYIRDIKISTRPTELFKEIDPFPYQIIDVCGELMTIREVLGKYDSLKRDLSAYASAKEDLTKASNVLTGTDFSMVRDIGILINSVNASLHKVSSEMDKIVPVVNDIRSGKYSIPSVELGMDLMNLFSEELNVREK